MRGNESLQRRHVYGLTECARHWDFFASAISYQRWKINIDGLRSPITVRLRVDQNGNQELRCRPDIDRQSGYRFPAQELPRTPPELHYASSKDQCGVACSLILASEDKKKKKKELAVEHSIEHKMRNLRYFNTSNEHQTKE